MVCANLLDTFICYIKLISIINDRHKNEVLYEENYEDLHIMPSKRRVIL